MNILLLTAHDIAEYDDLRMLTDLGYDVFSIGAYTDPANHLGGLRPPLDVPAYPELAALCEIQRQKHANDPMTMHVGRVDVNVVDWAKADLHLELIDWADVLICHHYEEAWLVGQWDRIRHKRVIWRTCGQSDARKEEVMGRLHDDGLQIVRYSPKEQVAFTRLGVFAGQDALIRFGKYPSDYGPWIGDDPVVGNVTQNMAGRGQFCGLYWYLEATRDLPCKPAGPESERLPGGIGALPYEEMLAYLTHIRAYIYTGTQPASYTLGLMEAMLAGVPVVSIGPEEMWVPDLFEGHEIAHRYSDTPSGANIILRGYLDFDEQAAAVSARTRAIAWDLFAVSRVGPQWLRFLGAPSRTTMQGLEVVA